MKQPIKIRRSSRRSIKKMFRYNPQRGVSDGNWSCASRDTTLKKRKEALKKKKERERKITLPEPRFKVGEHVVARINQKGYKSKEHVKILKVGNYNFHENVYLYEIEWLKKDDSTGKKFKNSMWKGNHIEAKHVVKDVPHEEVDLTVDEATDDEATVDEATVDEADLSTESTDIIDEVLKDRTWLNEKCKKVSTLPYVDSETKAEMTMKFMKEWEEAGSIE